MSMSRSTIEVPSNSEVIIKPRLKINQYDNYINNPASHLVRYGWDKSFDLKFPEDYGLGISKDIDRNDLPSQFQELYIRFVNLGFIEQYGDQCILISCVLRRILRLHGFSSSAKQMICYWANDEKGQATKFGLSDQRGPGNPVEYGSIDAHMAVSCNGYILDFALKNLQTDFGFLAPRALIGVDTPSDEYQDFGISGQAVWVDVKPQNPIIKHWRLDQHQLEHELTKKYFSIFQF